MISAATLDLQALNDSGALTFQDVSGLDLIIDLGLLTSEFVDGVSVLATADLIAAGLVEVIDGADADAKIKEVASDVRTKLGLK